MKYNPPLYINQILEPRETDKPKWKIVEFQTTHQGVLWFVQTLDELHLRRLTLSEIYAEFKFADPPY